MARTIVLVISSSNFLARGPSFLDRREHLTGVHRAAGFVAEEHGVLA
jgi:hypothetical protein